MHRINRIGLLAVAFACFAAGNAVAQELPTVVRYRPEITNASGDVVTSILPGETFNYSVHVQDVREDATGVFAAYVSLTFDASLFEVTGPIQHDITYGSGTCGESEAVRCGISGLLGGAISGVGGLDGIQPLGGNEYLVFSIPMQSTGRTGTGEFITGAPLDQIQLATLIYRDDSALEIGKIEFMPTSLTVVPEPSCLGLGLLAVVGFRQRWS